MTRPGICTPVLNRPIIQCLFGYCFPVEQDLLRPKCGAICSRIHEDHTVLINSCTKEVNYQYLCEFGPVAGSVKRNAHKETGLHLAPIVPLFRFPTVRCPDGHYTHRFLACDTKSHCWANKDVVLQTSHDALTVSTSSWCNTSMTSDEVYFLCSSGMERIPFTLVCDYVKDCFDGSDEDFCVHPPCSAEKAVPCGDSGQVCDQTILIIAPNKNHITMVPKCHSPSSRDPSARSRAEIDVLVGPRTAIVIGSM